MLVCKACDGTGLCGPEDICSCWRLGGDDHRGEARCDCDRLAVLELPDGQQLCDVHMFDGDQFVPGVVDETEMLYERSDRLLAALKVVIGQRDRLSVKSAVDAIQAEGRRRAVGR